MSSAEISSDACCAVIDHYDLALNHRCPEPRTVVFAPDFEMYGLAGVDRRGEADVEADQARRS